MKFNLLTFICIAIFSLSCNTPSATALEEEFQEGSLVTKVCSRGCYNYVLETGNKIYYPVNLSDELKESTKAAKALEVRFKGSLLDSETEITKPGPTDIPVFDFTCQDIKLSFIEALDQ